MSMSEVRRRLESLFPRVEDVPASADFAQGEGEYADGALYLVGGDVRRWTRPESVRARY